MGPHSASGPCSSGLVRGSSLGGPGVCVQLIGFRTMGSWAGQTEEKHQTTVELV